jgi:hypothetical protein
MMGFQMISYTTFTGIFRVSLNGQFSLITSACRSLILEADTFCHAQPDSLAHSKLERSRVNPQSIPDASVPPLGRRSA